jgi:hypothetical protein
MPMKTPSDPVARKTATSFRQDCTVRCDIHAAPERIWALLTDARAFPAWNSTVTSLEGDITLGSTLALKVPLDPKRTFRPKVTRLDRGSSNENEKMEMEWSDGFAPMFRGVRTFTLTPKADGMTEFAMTEVFSGLMLPLIRKSLPDFGPAFEAFARDLRRAAERGKAGDPS